MKRFLEGGSSGSDRNAAAPTGEAAPTPRVGTEGDSHKLSLDEKRQQSEAAEARVKQLTPEQIRADLSCANFGGSGIKGLGMGLGAKGGTRISGMRGLTPIGF